LASRPKILQSAGRAPSYFALSVRDDAGVEVAPGEIGELWVRGATVMKEYLNLPEQTAEVLRDGWLVTNDMAVIDAEGYIYLKDRRKFMIVTGGINVFPAGVEAVLGSHPAIRELAVIGVPHPVWGEAVIAVAFVEADSTATQADLLNYCEGKIARVMMPKYIHFVSEPLPKSANLKIQKHIIQRWFKDDPSLLPASFN
jgi:acyl-CoA synthetase (AMP-forming)/AMP-acid ligase II